MFKKLKDKLAEEVKSSPQRIQQFAQAAQAAVTSASSSISDITNSDLFSIGDNDGQQPRLNKPQSSQDSQINAFQDVSLIQPLQSPNDSLDYLPSHDVLESQRQRRLSNSSFASDVSFRLPSYETPSMYHLQSDMEVSASEAEERGFASGTVSLDRVTKEQLYAAYRRTQERYKKYRTQYGDLARHYKLLERENAKARSVLVETQDKALRRISELREQCSLEQSAKAHLEKALRIEIEEKSMKIEALNTKVQLLQNNSDICSNNDKNENKIKSTEGDGDVQLINLSSENDTKPSSEESSSSAAEISALNNKIEKMDQLMTKYKESLKTSKEKNSQINTELQILSNELESKNKEIEQLKITADQLTEAKQKIQELNNLNEELQNKVNVYEFNKTREISTLEVDYEKAQEEINELRGKIEIFSKREEEYAISLAENKLSIHKELESKETEIKSLKDSLDVSKKEIQSLNIVISDYKNNVSVLEGEKTKLQHDSSQLASSKSKMLELESQIEDLSKKCQNLEQQKTKADEGYKCLQLQMKQETAEKLAMIDRNSYLENRNSQLTEENSKKTTQITNLESELQKKEKALKDQNLEESKTDQLLEELDMWKGKYAKLESEIQEEREELIKLQSEIEKLLTNHELLQTQNAEYRTIIPELKSENATLQEKVHKYENFSTSCIKISNEVKHLKTLIGSICKDAKSLQKINNDAFASITDEIKCSLINIYSSETDLKSDKCNELELENSKLQTELIDYATKYNTVLKDYEMIQDENNNLKLTISEFETEKSIVDEEVKTITDRYETVMNELNVVKEENENLLYKINEFENNSQNIQIAMEFEKTQYLQSVERINMLEKENETLMGKMVLVESENKSLNNEFGELNDKFRDAMDKYDNLKTENNCLNTQVNELDNKVSILNKLQEDNKNLMLENISLKSQAESIADSYKNLETEINDVRKSHAEIEAEKDRLNEIIEKLETSSSRNMESKDIQTDDMWEEPIEEICTKELSSTQEAMQRNIEVDNELTKNYQTLKTDYDLIKEENRRFKSDIEGLQTYLTKISKENSVLNDKLRELIATSEHPSDNNVLGDSDDLKKEIQSGKEKIDDLLRENTLLIEENLELKDQLQFQNYAKSELQPSNDNGKETSILKEKYNNMLQVNSTLEKRLSDLEQMNKSVSGNMQQMQEKNEKLRSSNEKLERRLDEALVSLRHLHSLQENTELEYLRNILYEYLTGSGTHSVTLAKVLAAIVKFDDMQTKQVLQKEKERQGFLRQLGII